MFSCPHTGHLQRRTSGLFCTRTCRQQMEQQQLIVSAIEGNMLAMPGAASMYILSTAKPLIDHLKCGDLGVSQHSHYGSYHME